MTQTRDTTTLGNHLDERASSQKKKFWSALKNYHRSTCQAAGLVGRLRNFLRNKFLVQVSRRVLNKVVFALPTVGIARAFHPDAHHLSEKGYREIRLKLLDWAFTRALILSPPAISNRVRDSAVRSELFKQSVEALRPLLHTGSEADKIPGFSGSQSNRFGYPKEKKGLRVK